MRPRPPRPHKPSRGGHQSVWLYGHHAVLAALANPDRRVERLLVTKETAERHAAAFTAAGAGQKATVMSRATTFPGTCRRARSIRESRSSQPPSKSRR